MGSTRRWALRIVCASLLSFIAARGAEAACTIPLAGRTHRTPVTTPTISTRHDSTFASAPAEGSQNATSEGGQVEKYSPPVPNLHTGSIRLLPYAFILESSYARDSISIRSLPCSIDHAALKSRTKTEQKWARAKSFSIAVEARVEIEGIWDGTWSSRADLFPAAVSGVFGDVLWHGGGISGIL